MKAHRFSDINVAFPAMMEFVRSNGVTEESRNGPVTTIPFPMLIEHIFPERRVLFDPKRDANPFFHFMEAIWVLSGSRNLSFLEQFASNMAKYSDDGKTLNGAYGWRLRGGSNDGHDQIDRAILLLRHYPTTRRVVLSMWEPEDLDNASLDLPCNTHIYLRVVGEDLDMTVCNRSNDLVWGMLGANIVTFSYLHEYIAHACDLQAGSLFQFSNNVHIYQGMEDKFSADASMWYPEHSDHRCIPWAPETIDLREAWEFVNRDWDREYTSPVLKSNAIPMMRAHRAYKEGHMEKAMALATTICDSDWSQACIEWLDRRRK